ncbi:MAG TPA: hypothetical protein VG034_12810 [Acidimicrobiia bacterium]|jgi:hypothetical protein|nr:hypothetical protein [Acidimicrobiia bacterium]
MRLRSTLVTAMAALAVAATAAPALAHEEINPKTFPSGQPTFLTLTAANEASADLVRIVLRAPAGLAFGEATRSPAGWSAAGTDDTITWTGGAVKHDNFESWGFEIEGADQPGTLTYKVTLGYAGGKTDDVDVDVTATAPGSGGAGTATPATTVTTAATATSAPPTTAAAAPAESGGGSDGDSGPAKAALAVSIVALLVAAGALAVGARRSGGGPGANRGSGGGAAPGAAQDW